MMLKSRRKNVQRDILALAIKRLEGQKSHMSWTLESLRESYGAKDSSHTDRIFLARHEGKEAGIIHCLSNLRYLLESLDDEP